jgi:hypothetical protein
MHGDVDGLAVAALGERLFQPSVRELATDGGGLQASAGQRLLDDTAGVMTLVVKARVLSAAVPDV